MPSTIEGLAVLVLFFLPGYVAAQVYVRNEPYAEAAGVRFVLWIAFWSAIVHIAAFNWTAPLIPLARADLSAAAPPLVVWFLIFMLVLPALLGYAAGTLMRWHRARRFLAQIGMSIDDQLPTAWDFAFHGGRPGAFVRIHIRGLDAPLAGKLGEGSLAGVSPPCPRSLPAGVMGFGSGQLVRAEDTVDEGAVDSRGVNRLG